MEENLRLLRRLPCFAFTEPRIYRRMSTTKTVGNRHLDLFLRPEIILSDENLSKFRSDKLIDIHITSSRDNDGARGNILI